MELIHILPKNNVSLSHQVNPERLMVLTHLVESDEAYRKYHKKISKDRYLILDNSLIELGEAAGIEKVIGAAEKIGAHEIILPDVFQNCDATLVAVDEALHWLESRGLEKQYKLQAVCQGREREEVEYCFTRLSENEAISVIGIPKVLAKTVPGGRLAFEDMWLHCEKEIHLLGLWYTFQELRQYKHPEYIRSCDTCLGAFFSLYQMHLYSSIRPDGWTIDLQNDYLRPAQFGLSIMELMHSPLGSVLSSPISRFETTLGMSEGIAP